MINQVIVIRHSTRLDYKDSTWVSTSHTPYDPPLSPEGFELAQTCSKTISHLIPPENQVVIHSSPFIRCVQTAATLSQTISSTHNSSPLIRLDAVLGEWQTLDYYTKISPPPYDDHSSIQASSFKWLGKFNHNVDYLWPLIGMGRAGEYDEKWGDMYARVTTGFQNLLRYYTRHNNSHINNINNVTKNNDSNNNNNEGKFQNDSNNFTNKISLEKSPKSLIIVTHGACCNPLVGYLLKRPVVTVFGLTSFAAFSMDNDMKHDNDIPTSPQLGYIDHYDDNDDHENKNNQHNNDTDDIDRFKWKIIATSPDLKDISLTKSTSSSSLDTDGSDHYLLRKVVSPSIFIKSSLRTSTYSDDAATTTPDNRTFSFAYDNEQKSGLDDIHSVTPSTSASESTSTSNSATSLNFTSFSTFTGNEENETNDYYYNEKNKPEIGHYNKEFSSTNSTLKPFKEPQSSSSSATVLNASFPLKEDGNKLNQPDRQYFKPQFFTFMEDEDT